MGHQNFGVFSAIYVEASVEQPLLDIVTINMKTLRSIRIHIRDSTLFATCIDRFFFIIFEQFQNNQVLVSKKNSLFPSHGSREGEGADRAEARDPAKFEDFAKFYLCCVTRWPTITIVGSISHFITKSLTQEAQHLKYLCPKQAVLASFTLRSWC